MNPSLSFTVNGEQVVQFGAVREFERTTDLGTIVTGAMQWVLADVTRVTAELGLDVEDALESLQTFYVPAVTPKGPSHEDPLATSYARQRFPTLHPTVTVGWKFAINVVGDAPDHPNVLIEGESPRSH